MMTQRFLPLFTVLAIAAVLWVVPSIVSQGMVTVGERFGHADEGLLDSGGTTSEDRYQLRAADARVETAIASLQPSGLSDESSLAIADSGPVWGRRID